MTNKPGHHHPHRHTHTYAVLTAKNVQQHNKMEPNESVSTHFPLLLCGKKYLSRGSRGRFRQANCKKELERLAKVRVDSYSNQANSLQISEMMSFRVCSLEIVVGRPKLILTESWMQIWTRLLFSLPAALMKMHAAWSYGRKGTGFARMTNERITFVI